jgi:hypothetical protein
MISRTLLGLALLFAATALRAATVESSSSAPYFVEAGASYFLLDGADFGTSEASRTVVREDDAAWAPFIAVGRAFGDRWALRLSYHYLDGLSSAVDRTYTAGQESYLIWTRHSDDIHLLTLAPEFRLRLASGVRVSVSPAVNWVSARLHMQSHTNAPHIQIVPRALWTETGFTLGAGAAVTWSISDHWSTSLRYSYVDLDPARERRAHALSAGLQRNF